MEQQEERKMKVYERRRKRRQSSSVSKSNSSFPLDLVPEILLKLPAKSIVRFSCVSKLWSSITTDPYFINSFKTRSSPKSSLLIFFRKMDKLFAFSFPQNHQNSNNESYSSQHVDRYQMNLPKDLSLSSKSSVHGLICFQNSAAPIIWNPTTRQILTLPKPEGSSREFMTYFLGYDPIEGKHKVVCMAGDECWVITLGSSSWRRIKANPYRCIHKQVHCINGVIYYLQYNPEQSVLMSFDVRSETFQPITLPLVDWELRIVYEGRLAFVCRENRRKRIKMLVLEDGGNEKWVEKSFRAPFDLDDTKFRLSGATEDGEFIYLPSTFLKSSFSILYFDPRRYSFRKVEFEGIANEEFGISNRLRRKPKSLIEKLNFDKLQAFPNHIDSLISL